MFLFNREEVYVGFSLKELANVREALAVDGIQYKYRVVNLSGNKSRRSFGGYNGNRDFERQYYVYVQKKDYERGKYIVNKALHKP